MTDADLDSARKRIEKFRTETHEILAEELGGDSEDYRADRYRELEADGGNHSTTSTESVIVPCATFPLLIKAVVAQG